MDDEHVALIRQLIENNRQDINHRLDDHAKLIHDIGETVKQIASEYDQVLVEQRAAKVAAETAALLAKAAVDKADASQKKVRGYIAIFASATTITLAALPYILKVLHLG